MAPQVFMKFQILYPSSTPPHLLTSSQLVVKEALKRSNAREVKGLFLNFMRIESTKINKAIFKKKYIVFDPFPSEMNQKFTRIGPKTSPVATFPRYVMTGFASSVIYVV